MTRLLLAWGPAVGWALVLFGLSSRPSVPSPRIPGVDKVAHLVMYAVLGALLARAGARSGVATGWIVLAGILYGASDEWHQAYVPGRSSSVADWVADAVGVLAGVLLYHRWRTRQPRTA